MKPYAVQRIDFRDNHDQPIPSTISVGALCKAAPALVKAFMKHEELGPMLRQAVRDSLGFWPYAERVGKVHPAFAWAVVDACCRLLQLKSGVDGAAAEIEQVWERYNLPPYRTLYRIILPAEGYPVDYCSELDHALEEIVNRLRLGRAGVPDTNLSSKDPEWKHGALAAFNEAQSEGEPSGVEVVVDELNNNGFTVYDAADNMASVIVRGSPEKLTKEETEPAPSKALEWLYLCVELGADPDLVKEMSEESTPAEWLTLLRDKIKRVGDDVVIQAGVWKASIEADFTETDLEDAESDLREFARKQDLLQFEVFEYYSVGDCEDWLREAGEVVFEWDGQTIWGRGCCGQAIKGDGTIGIIGRARDILPGLRNSWVNPRRSAETAMGEHLVKKLELTSSPA